MPTSDAQVAAHFALKRPTLGICLKRYMITAEGQCERMDTFVDIPLEIAVPDFVSDDSMGEGSPLVGNFKLVLQSVVCHRGKSVHSGHYISLVRGQAANAVSVPGHPATSASSHIGDSWMLFDDLAKERVRYVDIASALKEECPYLLFYQVRPIDDDEPMMSGPPSYDEAISRSNSEPLDASEKIALPEYSDGDAPYAPTPDPASRTYLSTTEPPSRTSIDDPRGRPSISSERRRSIAFDADRSSIALTTSGPPTPADESRLDFLKLPSRRGSRQSSGRKTKSRPPSVGADAASRFSLNMSRLTTRMSKTDLPPVAASPGVQGLEGGIVAVDHETGHVEVQPHVPAGEKLRKKEKQPAHTHGQEEGGETSMIGRKIRRKGEVPDRDCRVM